jgi:hypothetical protein
MVNRLFSRSALGQATAVGAKSSSSLPDQPTPFTLTRDDGDRGSLRNVRYQPRTATADDDPVLVRAGLHLSTCLVSVCVLWVYVPSASTLKELILPTRSIYLFIAILVKI